MGWRGRKRSGFVCWIKIKRRVYIGEFLQLLEGRKKLRKK